MLDPDASAGAIVADAKVLLAGILTVIGISQRLVVVSKVTSRPSSTVTIQSLPPVIASWVPSMSVLASAKECVLMLEPSSVNPLNNPLGAPGSVIAIDVGRSGPESWVRRFAFFVGSLKAAAT